MDDKVIVSVDAMGGDNAPAEIVKGCIEALELSPKLYVKLVGKEALVSHELEQYQFDKSRIEVINADDVISFNEAPVNAIRRKKNSSIVVGLNLVKNGEADAFLSAGSTGAILVGAQLIVGRIKGVERPPLASVIPTMKGISLIVDCGANVDARSNHLVQFAKMGSIYFENAFGIKNPKVGIVNIGVEEEKGNQLVKETFPLLKDSRDINFIGSIEARDIPNGDVDVIVCEGFTGNVILKLYEGTAKAILTRIKTAFLTNIRSKIGALLVKPALKDTLKPMDPSNHGSAPMLGLNNLVLKTHGSAKAKEVKNSLLQAITFTEMNISEKIKACISNEMWEEENGI